MQRRNSQSRGFIEARFPLALEVVSTEKTVRFFQRMSTYRILQENLQDPRGGPTRYRAVIYKISTGNLERKDQRLGSSGSNQEVGAIPSHIFEVK